jgi:uncharacterized MAPEG superfamily protein
MRLQARGELIECGLQIGNGLGDQWRQPARVVLAHGELDATPAFGRSSNTPFAAVVLIASATGVSGAVTEACAAVYFYARVAHAVIHVSGVGFLMARTVAFTVAWVAFMVFAVVVLQRAT